MFTQVLYAQGAEGGAMGAMAPQLMMMAAIFAIFYFLLIRPQKQQQKKLAAAINALKKGDKVIIAGGMLAEYVSDKEDGVAIVKINSDTKVEIFKSSISTVVVDKPKDDAKGKGKKEDKNEMKEELKKIEENDNSK